MNNNNYTFIDQFIIVILVNLQSFVKIGHEQLEHIRAQIYKGLPGNQHIIGNFGLVISKSLSRIL